MNVSFGLAACAVSVAGMLVLLAWAVGLVS